MRIRIADASSANARYRILDVLMINLIAREEIEAA